VPYLAFEMLWFRLREACGISKTN